MSDWTRDYFERGYAQRWGLRPPGEQIRQEADALWKQLKLERGSRLLDIGCGHGRHALALAEHGARVVGVDRATALLNRARDLTIGYDVSLVQSDMRRVPLRSNCCDAAMVIDAFGFFETAEEDFEVLLEGARVVRAMGRVGLKVANGGAILASFRDADEEQHDGVNVTISRTLSLAPARMTETITITGPRGEGTYERRQRLYSADELRDVLERAGVREIKVFADPNGSPFDVGRSPAMWVFGEI